MQATNEAPGNPSNGTPNDECPSQQDGDANNNSKRPKSRHHASVACASCRDRRIRCVVPPGESECQQCQRGGTQCIIKNDDERRRPISRAYMSTLTDRVALLESMLKESGTEPPPVVYPPKTTRGRLPPTGEHSPFLPTRKGSQSQLHIVCSTENPSPKSIRDEAANDSANASTASFDGQRDRSERNSSTGTPIDDKKDGLVGRLLSTRGHLSFDQLSGRLRFYGGTVNCHIYSELDVDDSKSSRESAEQARRAEKCIRSLPVETHDYLMELFWLHYNDVLHVVHEEAFNEDREAGRTQFYSGFLHVCILAVGYRFADKERADIARLTLPDRESNLHREVKYMLDLELEHLGGIPSIAALLILGDLEVGVGRDNTGWMYAGMAMRLCYDIGLQLDSRQAGLSQRETEIRRMTLWACVVYDRYWGLFLGRPLAMKSVDLEIHSLSNQFERLGTCMPAGPEKSINTKIYEALIELMEIAGKIVEHAEFRGHRESPQNPNQQAYCKMAALDRELHSWAARLPPALRYTDENRRDAPSSFYLLHQQYHAVLILLHRPFARYDDLTGIDGEEVSALCAHFARACRAICTKSAVSVARIFWQHRQKFDGRKLFCTAMQHAGSAATALVAALANIPDAAGRNNNMQYLEVLHAALYDMSHAYQPAERMAQVLDAVMIELKGGPISPRRASMPARRGSSAIEAERGTSKRRHMARTQQSQIMPPPPTPVPAPQQLHPMPADFGALPPRSDVPVWPNMSGHEVVPAQQHIMSIPVSMGPSEQRQEWISQIGSDYPLVSPMPAIAGIPDGNVNSLGFVQLPSEEDWRRWHATANPDLATDLDGFPPRALYQNNTFDSSPTGGNMN